MISRKQMFILLVVSLCGYSATFAQSSHKNLLEGDKFYKSGNLTMAEESYRKAREKDRELKSTFNLGNTVYSLERYEEAIDHYTAATQLAPDNIKRSDAYFNLGNAYVRNGNAEEAIDAYKEAISLKPTNEDAKYNLLVVKKSIREAEQQEQEQQQEGEPSDEQQDGEKQEQQEQQDGQENGEPQEGQDEQDQKEGEEKPEENSEQNQDIKPGGEFDTTRLDKQSLDSLDAMKLLQVIENEEKKVQEKLKKFNSNRKKPDKDW